jgi:type I restriction enzyme, S subunit
MMSKGDRRELDTGEGMSEWQEIRLGDICDIYDGPHATPPKQNSGCIFLGISSLGFDGKIDPSQFEYISEEFYKKWTRRIVPQTDDIVFSYETKLGVAALLPKNFKCCLGRRMGLMRIKSDVIPRFLLYAYLAPDFQKTIYERTIHGSTVDRIPLKDFPDFPISIPPLPEQKAIASILSSLDDKIDLLHRQNRTLEAIAETLFRQWFIEEAQDDWTEGLLGDLVVFNYGKTLKEQERSGAGFPVFGSSGIVGYHENYLVEAPGIVTGRKGTLGVVNYSFDNFTPIDTTFYITSKIESCELLFEYFLLKELNLGEMNTDSAVPGLNRNLAHGIKISIPPTARISDFNQAVSPIFKKVKHHNIQIQTLEKLRNNLLPKLMSGEVRVEI